MKRIVLLIIVVLLIVGCAKDIIIEPQSDIRGYYEGIYESTLNLDMPGENTKNQKVDWIFTDFRFDCKKVVDSNVVREICDFSGNYTMGDRLVFKDTSVATQICNRADIPFGEFDIVRTEDSIFLTQIDRAAYTKKKIRLKKLSD